MTLNGVTDEAKRRLFAIFAHNHNETTRMARAVAATRQGLPASEFATPYPGTQQTSNTTITGAGVLKGAMLGAALLGGGAFMSGAMNRPQVLQTQPIVDKQPAQVTPDKPIAPHEFDRVTRQTVDGKLKEVGRQRIRVWADGRIEKLVNGQWTQDDGK